MSKTLPLLTAAALVFALAGCTAPAASPSESSSAVPDDRGAQFLAAACPAFAADVAFNAVWSDPTTELEPILTTAAAARDAGSAFANDVDGFATQWTELSDDLVLVRDMYEGKVASYTTIAEATSLDALLAITFADVTAGNDAFLRVEQALEVGVEDC